MNDLLKSIQAKRNNSMCVHDGIGYAEMVEKKFLERKYTKAIEDAKKERERFPELYGEVNLEHPPKYLIPVSIRVKAKRIYYALKDALS